MEDRLTELKTDFVKFVDLKQDNVHTLTILDGRIKKIKQIYSEFIQTNREQLFIFTLDSFYFQSKLIDIEYEDILRVFHSITNRMYCDYYKLFKIIIDYVFKNIPDKKLIELIHVNDHFPVYKDLEPFKQYDFQYIQNLHEIILVILTYLYGHITNKEHDLKIYQTKNKIGLHIDSFVNTFNFNNTVMKEKINLFVTYIEFFHKLHTKYFRRFTTKTHLLLSQINNDIKLDNPMDAHNKKKEIMNDFAENNIDTNVLRELRHSISDDSSSTGSIPAPSIREQLRVRISKESESCLVPPTPPPTEISVIEESYYDISELSQEENNIIRPKFSMVDNPSRNSPKEMSEIPLKPSLNQTPSEKQTSSLSISPIPEIPSTDEYTESTTSLHSLELLSPPPSPSIVNLNPVENTNNLIPLTQTSEFLEASDPVDEYIFTVDEK